MLGALGKTLEHFNLKESAASSKSQAKSSEKSQTAKKLDKPLGEDHSSFSTVQRHEHLRDLKAKVTALRDMGVRSSPGEKSREYFSAAEDLVKNMHGIYTEPNSLKRSALRHTNLENPETRHVHDVRSQSKAYIASGRKLDSEIRQLNAATVAKRKALTAHAAETEASNGHELLPSALNQHAVKELAGQIHSMVRELLKIKVAPEVLESILTTATPQAAKWKAHWNGVASAEPLKAMQLYLTETRHLSDVYSEVVLLGTRVEHTGHGDLKRMKARVADAKEYAAKDSNADVAPVVARMTAILEKSKNILVESTSHDLTLSEPTAERPTKIAKAAIDRAGHKIGILRAVEHAQTEALAKRFEEHRPKQTT